MRNLILICAATLGLTACSLERLTGTKPAAKSLCYRRATTSRDSLTVAVVDATGRVVDSLHLTTRFETPAGLYPCS